MDELNKDGQAVDTAKQYIVVNIGNEQYGININNVDNIVRMQKITRVPKAQPFFVGVINLRGEVLPVMSLRKKFELPDDEYTDSTRIIIIKMEQQGMVGFIVDSVKEVITLEDNEIEKGSVTSSDEGNAYVSGVGKLPNGLVSLMNLNAVIVEKENV